MFNLKIKHLKLATLGYLALPVILFFLTWVKVFIGVSMIALFAVVFYRYAAQLPKEETESFEITHLLLVLFVGLVWLSYSGVGGFGVKVHDHYKLYALAKDIAENAKPVLYEFNGQKYYLSAYLGYFITAPVLMGWAGYNAVQIFVFAYGFIGISLVLIWHLVLTNQKTVWTALIFIFIGGFDIAGYLFQNGFNFADSIPQFYWWNSLQSSDYLLYHGNSNLLFWSAPHTFPGWLASGIFFYDLIKKEDLKWSPVYLFTLVFWSPFILVGLLPYFVLKLLSDRFQGYFKWENILLVIPMALLAWFVTSVGVSDLDQGHFFRNVASGMQGVEHMFNYLWFIFFEVMIWGVIIYVYTRQSDFFQKNKKWFFLMLILLAFIPLYKLGKYNDWVQRVSMPSLFLLWVFVIRMLNVAKLKYAKILVGGLIFISSLDSITYWITGISETKGLFGFDPLKKEEVLPMPQAAVENGWPIEQFLAPEDASFFKYIAKENLE
ncbi:hypothetical protein [Jiulongibacter sp. NS-SX5]|uniref:hypothetical protein n=1 Tax=Jiulongibacter sp. NS-SX5 TaxID=3463854 RepID=UPI004059BFA2